MGALVHTQMSERRLRAINFKSSIIKSYSLSTIVGEKKKKAAVRCSCWQVAALGDQSPAAGKPPGRAEPELLPQLT